MTLYNFYSYSFLSYKCLGLTERYKENKNHLLILSHGNEKPLFAKVPFQSLPTLFLHKNSDLTFAGTSFCNLKLVSFPLLNIKDNFSIFMHMNILPARLYIRYRLGSCAGQERTGKLLKLQTVWVLGIKPMFPG